MTIAYIVLIFNVNISFGSMLPFVGIFVLLVVFAFKTKQNRELVAVIKYTRLKEPYIHLKVKNYTLIR